MTNKPREISRIPLALKRAIRSLVSGESPWPLFLYGPPGTGKTCAALALLDHAGGIYHTAHSLCDELMLAYKGHLHYKSGRPIHAANLWSHLSEAPLVVLDEIGIREVKDIHYETVKRLLDDRESRPLVVISNHDLERVQELYDPRIASRLGAGSVVYLAGEDQRLKR